MGDMETFAESSGDDPTFVSSLREVPVENHAPTNARTRPDPGVSSAPRLALDSGSASHPSGQLAVL